MTTVRFGSGPTSDSLADGTTAVNRLAQSLQTPSSSEPDSFSSSQASADSQSSKTGIIVKFLAIAAAGAATILGFRSKAGKAVIAFFSKHGAKVGELLKKAKDFIFAIPEKVRGLDIGGKIGGAFKRSKVTVDDLGHAGIIRGRQD